VLYDIGWDSLVCTAAGGCTICVWASDNTLDTSHTCLTGGTSGNNGFTFSGTAKFSTFSIGMGSTGTHTVTLTVTAPLSGAKGGVTVNACLEDLTTTNGCNGTEAGTSSAISTQFIQAPEFQTGVVLVSALGLAGLLLVRRKSIAPAVHV